MYIQIIKAVHVFKNCPKIRNGQKELWFWGVVCTHFSAATQLASQTWGHASTSRALLLLSGLLWEHNMLDFW